MKKLALISGLLFVVVYLVVNTVTSDDNSFDVIYPPVSSKTLSEPENLNDPAKQVTSTATTDKNTGTYIVIASFNDPAQARNAADDYSEQFNAGFIVLPPSSGGYYRISYGKYSSMEEAQDALESVRQKGFPDAWILSSK